MKTYAKVLAVVGVIASVAACDRDDDERVERPATPPPAEEPRAAPGTGMAPGEREKDIDRVRGLEADEARDAKELVQDAAVTLRKMKADTGMTQLLRQAKGVFIVPEYGRAAAGVGARGGEGVLLAKEKDGDKWNGPAFYDVGGISVGAQFGGEGGEIAMVLMNDKSLSSFKNDDTFSLNADAKLTVVDFSALAGGSLGKAGDVVFWSDTEGAFAGVALSATDISWDDEENPAYYGRKVSAGGVIDGTVTPKMGALEQALSGI